MPMYRRSSRIAATAVVPSPMNGSITRSSLPEKIRITRRGNSSGNWASCSLLLRTEGIFQTALDPHSIHSSLLKRFRSMTDMPGFQKM